MKQSCQCSNDKIIIIMQRKQYCQLQQFWRQKISKLNMISWIFPMVPTGWNVIIMCKLWHWLLLVFKRLSLRLKFPDQYFWLLDSIKKSEVLIKFYEFQFLTASLAFQFQNNPAKQSVGLMWKKLNLKPIFLRLLV